MRTCNRPVPAFLAAALLLPLAACTDSPANAVVCPILMNVTPQVEPPATHVTISFATPPSPTTRLDPTRPVRATVIGDAAGRATAEFRPDPPPQSTAPPRPPANTIGGTLVTSLNGSPFATVELIVPLIVAGTQSCGIVTTTVAAPLGNPAVCADVGSTTRQLQKIVDSALLTLNTPSDRLFTRLPLTPMRPEVTLPGVGPLSTSVLPVPLPGGVSDVRFSVTWGIADATGYATSPDARSFVDLGIPSTLTSVVVRILPPVVPVADGDPTPPGAVQPRITARVHASLPACRIELAAAAAMQATAPRVALPLPRVLALYRGADMGTTNAAWRTMETHNSGVVVFGSGTDLAAPRVPLASLAADAVAPGAVPRLDGLGVRLAEIVGPVPTRHGEAGLAALPAGAVPAAIAGPVADLRRLSETIALLTRTFAALAAHKPPARFARLDARAALGELGDAVFIDHEVGLPVHVQDEAEAAILIGPAGSAADLYTLPQFNVRTDGVIHTDAGVARLTTSRSGYVAVVPDLAVTGRACNARGFGWLPVPSASYETAHPTVTTDAYGSVTVRREIDEDRPGWAPDVRRESVAMTDAQHRALNDSRRRTISRTMSSLQIGDTSMRINGGGC